MNPVGSTNSQPLASTRIVGRNGEELQRAGSASNGSSASIGPPGKSPTVTTPEQKGFQPKEPSANEFKPYVRTGSQETKPAGEGEKTQNVAAQTGVLQEKQDPQIQAQITQLKSIEEKVKAHEAAHKAAGGAMTGPVSYSYTRGPDGKSYITGGEVPISVTPGKTPQETISRMQQVIQAALAPADPSPQDRAVAGQAAAQQQEARQQLSATPATSETQPAVSVEPGKLADSIVARDSRRAYGNPAVTGKKPEFIDTADPANSDQQNPVSSVTGTARAPLDTVTPANITGFGQPQQISYYA
ncbi:MAG: putative metalloprotease CJM1_0395 family protein [Desulfuromonadaceae bacterium]|nr:putative metalloprotease CJM1_0395 family protein [Desulfuromonadaceae bacterium]